MAYEPDSTYGEVTKPSKEQEAYTASHAMTRDEFIKKYALGEGGTFVADDKGGNAASEVAGQNVADYYDTYLSKDAKQTQTLRGVEGDTREAPMDWGQGRYSNTHPYFDGYDNVNPLRPIPHNIPVLRHQPTGRPITTDFHIIFCKPVGLCNLSRSHSKLLTLRHNLLRRPSFCAASCNVNGVLRHSTATVE